MRPKLLIVEDNEPSLSAMRDYFDAHGFEVHCAPDREHAEAELVFHDFDLVITDLRLGSGLESEGLEVVSRARSSSPGASVVVLTSYGSPEVREEALRRGALHVLDKPLPLDEVLRISRQASREPGDAPMRAGANRWEAGVAQAALGAAGPRDGPRAGAAEGAAGPAGWRFAAVVGRALTRGLALDAALADCAQAVVDQLGADCARIWVLDEDEDVLVLRANAGLDTHLEAHRAIPIGADAIGWIATSRSPIATNDVANDPGFAHEWTTREGLCAFAGYPLIVHDRLLGVIAMFSRGTLGPETLEAMAAVAAPIALGVEVQEARERAQDHLQQEGAIAELGRLALSGLAIERLLEDAARRVGGVLRVEQAEILERSDYVAQAPASRHLDRDARASLAVAIEGGAGPSRVLAVHSRRPRCFRTDEIHFVESVARVLSIALERERAETDLRRLEHQLLQSQKMEAIGRLAGGVAHDFNNFLTTIIGYAQILRRNAGLAPGVMRDLDEIHRAADRAAGLTRQLLASSRTQILQPTVLDLRLVIAEVDRMLQRLIGEDIELVTAVTPDLPRVRADRGQIEQVLMNLIVNSRDAMPDGGRITIELGTTTLGQALDGAHGSVPAGDWVTLAIGDTGLGMDPATYARIFEPFFTTKEVGRGTGLGLSTVYGIVKQSAGHIAVESEEGRGTTFRIYLPAAGDEPSPVAPPAFEEPAGGDETVLLVEDEAAVRGLAARVLRDLGYFVLEAANGVQALEISRRYRGREIHLVITDIVMPRMNGRQLVERVQPERRHTRFLFTSGYSDQIILAPDEPGVFFLGKPFTPTELARTVRQVLDG